MCEAARAVRVRDRALTLKTGHWEPLPRLLNSFFVVGKISEHKLFGTSNIDLVERYSSEDKNSR